LIAYEMERGAVDLHTVIVARIKPNWLEDAILDARRLFRDVAHALCAMHDASVVHLDIKAENVLVSRVHEPTARKTSEQAHAKEKPVTNTTAKATLIDFGSAVVHPSSTRPFSFAPCLHHPDLKKKYQELSRNRPGGFTEEDDVYRAWNHYAEKSHACDKSCGVFLTLQKQGIVCSETCGRSTGRAMTHGYQAPEIYVSDSCEKTDLYAADVYSLGILLYMMVFGSIPWEENVLRKWKANHSSSPHTTFEKEYEKFFSLPEKPSHNLMSWSFLRDTIPNPITDKILWDLLRGMLHPIPTKRYTMKQVLEHPWVQGKSKPWKESFGTVSRLPQENRADPHRHNSRSSNKNNDNNYHHHHQKNTETPKKQTKSHKNNRSKNQKGGSHTKSVQPTSSSLSSSCPRLSKTKTVKDYQCDPSVLHCSSYNFQPTVYPFFHPPVPFVPKTNHLFGYEMYQFS
jgi:serine/threonine protein kinase